MTPGAPGGPPTGLACLAIGATAGLASGMLGIGGGLVVVPLLAGWLGVPVKRAVGTSLVVVLTTAVVAVAAETVVAPDNLRWTAAAWLASGALVGAFLGTRIVARTPARALALMLAALLLVAATRMAGVIPMARGPGVAALPSVLEAAAHAGAGLLAGTLAAMFGIGGGIIAVPALAMLHGDWPFQACRATSLVMIIPTSLLAAWLHRRLENVDVALARTLAPSAAAAAVAGVIVANRVPGRPLELAFAGLLVLSAARIAMRQRSPAAGAAEPLKRQD